MFFLLDKPSGMTSFAAVQAVRRVVGAKKAGHAGTLDPLATGLLLVATDADTKRLHEYVGLPKTYDAEILLGVRTDTGDAEGKVLEERAVSVREGEVREALAGIVGTHIFPVPIYSAVKQGGEPLYRKVRRGEKVITPKREMEVLRAELRAVRRVDKHTIARVVFEVGSGTYIRSLAEALGERLTVPASLNQLRRVSIGNFSVADAKSPNEVSAS